MSPEGLVSFQPQEVRHVGIVISPCFLVAGCGHNANATQTGVMGVVRAFKNGSYRTTMHQTH